MLTPFFNHKLDETPTTATITISTNRTDFNIIEELGYTPLIPMAIDIVIDPGVEISSTNTAWAALDVSGLPSGSVVDVDNEGYILGKGGKGGEASAISGTYNGFAGGPAIFGPGPGSTLDITNASGNIWGGGGGGSAGGATLIFWNPYEPDVSYGAAGGGGAGLGEGGTVNDPFSSFGTVDPGNPGTGGPAGAPGTGGTFNFAGATGGVYGAAGANGTGTLATGTGGAAGAAINSNGATVNFISGGTAPNVKGAVI
jgi:hypothetical protein